MSKTVLIAEDDTFFAQTIQMALKEHGVDVRTVKNGQEAIEFIRRKQPDLLLLDLLMPRKDGFAVLSYVKKHNLNFPIVILSNFSDQMNEVRSSAMGVKDYFIKSDMDEDELWPKIKKYL